MFSEASAEGDAEAQDLSMLEQAPQLEPCYARSKSGSTMASQTSVGLRAEEAEEEQPHREGSERSSMHREGSTRSNETSSPQVREP